MASGSELNSLASSSPANGSAPENDRLKKRKNNSISMEARRDEPKGDARAKTTAFPSELDLEKLVIGGIFSNADPNQCFTRVSDILNESSFTLEKHKLVFAAMRNIVSRGLLINYGTVTNELQDKDHLRRIGSLINFTKGLSELHNIESFCKLIAECAQRRKVYFDLQDLMPRVLGRDPLDKIANDVKALISSLEAKQHSMQIDEIKSVYAFNSAGMEFAIDRVIACSAVTGITGDAGAGKTTLVTALGAHVACGEDFLGRSCTQRKVLILDRENTLPVVQERLTRLHIQDGGDLKIWGGWNVTEAPEPSAPNILRWVVQTTPKPLVIVDSFIAFINGDENDSYIVRTFMQQLRRLADAGAGVVVLHHTGKGESSQDYRGSSDFKAAIDVGFSLKEVSGGSLLERLRMKAFKTRFTVENDLIINYADGQFSADNRPNAVSRTVTQQLTELLRQNPGICSGEFEELASKRNLGRDRARQFLRDGVKAGDIRQEKGTRNSHFNYLPEPRD